jgi:Lrp/AsnC family transcriptional regulator, regulator for asnA, asnC and gidA
MMDEFDKKILSKLSQDGRLTNIKLAQLLGVNPATIAKRIDEMQKENVFVMRAVPNPYKLGRNIHAFITLSVDLNRVESVSAKLVMNSSISSLLTAFGKYNILLIVDFNSWELLVDFIKNDISKIDGINDMDIKFISEMRKRSYDLFPVGTEDNKPEQIDEIDENLINELEKNGKLSYASLAEKLNTSNATISRRINSLIKRDMIKIVAVPNPTKLGFNINSLIHLRVQTEKLDDVCEKISSYPEVHSVMTLINNFDIVVGVHFPTSEMMHDFIVNNVAAINGIVNIETYIRAEVKKILYSPKIIA